MAKKKLIDVYPYAVEEGQIRFLLFKRQAGQLYEESWRMIGGKVEPDERADIAAMREFAEETALSYVKFWCIPQINRFWDVFSKDVVEAVPFAVEIQAHESPVLNKEHSAWAWFRVEDLTLEHLWPQQLHILKLVHAIVQQNAIRREWEL